MKPFRIVTLIIAVLAICLTVVPAKAGPKAASDSAVPKYDRAAEATFKGVVEEVRDRQCPVSGGMGSHLVLKLASGSTIEVHLATTKFVHTYDMLFKKGDAVEVTGVKVQFEGVETIFAREVTRDGATFVFRDKAGSPVW
jgi:DNA/RNA endonuclease YhcR with UshA esterase domain